MFKSVRIQNFRQFKDLKLDGLAQINLITGKNDAGKTSLLEAFNLLLAPGDPGIVMSLARLRGIDRIAVDGSHAWGFIFNDGQIEQRIVMESRESEKRLSTLRIGVAMESESTVADEAKTNGAAGVHTIPTVTSLTSGLKYECVLDSDGQVGPIVSRISQVGRRWVIERAEIPNLRPWYFRAHRPADVGQSEGDDAARPHEFEAEAQRFSQLVLQRRKAEVIEAVRVVEPRVTDLEVLDLPPSTVAADIGLNTLVPMSYLGLGFEQMLKVIQAILLTAGGTVLIDEIEHGFHYSVLPGVWKAITKAAVASSVQIVATTHSMECIEAAIEASEGREDGLALYRLTRRHDDVRATRVEHEGMSAAVEFALELR